MIYLDSSALLKLIVDEPETAVLAAWLADRPEVPVESSELARVEVLLARGAQRIAHRTRALSGVDLVPLSGSVVDVAAELEGETLRSLDALHLASALAVSPLRCLSPMTRAFSRGRSRQGYRSQPPVPAAQGRPRRREAASDRGWERRTTELE